MALLSAVYAGTHPSPGLYYRGMCAVWIVWVKCCDVSYCKTWKCHSFTVVSTFTGGKSIISKKVPDMQNELEWNLSCH